MSARGYDNDPRREEELRHGKKFSILPLLPVRSLNAGPGWLIEPRWSILCYFTLPARFCRKNLSLMIR